MVSKLELCSHCLLHCDMHLCTLYVWKCKCMAMLTDPANNAVKFAMRLFLLSQQSLIEVLKAPAPHSTLLGKGRFYQLCVRRFGRSLSIRTSVAIGNCFGKAQQPFNLTFLVSWQVYLLKDTLNVKIMWQLGWLKKTIWRKSLTFKKPLFKSLHVL